MNTVRFFNQSFLKQALVVSINTKSLFAGSGASSKKFSSAFHIKSSQIRTDTCLYCKRIKSPRRSHLNGFEPNLEIFWHKSEKCCFKFFISTAAGAGASQLVKIDSLAADILQARIRRRRLEFCKYFLLLNEYRCIDVSFSQHIEIPPWDKNGQLASFADR